MLKLLLSVVLFQTVLSALVVPEKKHSLKRCVNKILANFIAKHTTVLYMYNTFSSEPLSHPMMNPIINFDVGKVTIETNNYIFYSDVVIIDARSIDFFGSIWNSLGASRMWTINNLNKRKFILILPIEEIHHTSPLLYFLWRMDIANVFIIMYDLKLKQDVTWLITGDPLHPINRCGNAAKQIYRRPCDEVSTSPFLEMSTKYSDCRMFYLHRKQSDIDGITSPVVASTLFVLDIINEVLNITIVPKLAVQIQESKYLITRCTLPACSMLSSTSPYLRIDFLWIVPSPKRINALEVFKAWWFIAKCECASDLVSAMLQIYSATLYGFINRTPSFLPLRWMFIAYVIYAIHIQSIFVSNLVRLLTVPQYEGAINNLEDLADSNVPIIVDKIKADLFKGDDKGDTLYNKIKSKLLVVTKDEYFHSVLDNSVVILQNHSILITEDLLNQAIMIRNVKFKYFKDNGLLGQPSTILQTKPGSSIHHLLKKIVDILLESGLMDYEIVEYERTLTKYMSSVNPVVEDKVVLTLNHLYPVSVFWGAGIVISTVVFFAEILKHRIEEKRNRS
ncbi:hypothetical protein FQA39_LY07776 [Lamprigera yunnana]|nr:hypothetical protein FQA39_LY07776 [Lamprigera yunnana]